MAPRPDGQQSEPVDRLWLDSDAFAALDLDVPAALELWRLRLRFGLPARIARGERFRVAVDLVDEMGQPPPARELERVAQRLGAPRLRLRLDRGGGAASEPAEAAALASSLVETRRRTPGQWAFDVAIARDAAAAATRSLRLLVALDPASDAAGDASAAHRALQRFCAHSVWLSGRVLVLPFESEAIQVLEALGEAPAPRTNASASGTRRLFRVPTRPAAGPSDRVVAVSEDYGAAMGAHVWDASILLGLALVEAAPRVRGPPMAVLELGAGCGLVACVLHALYSRAGEPSALVLTERPESLGLLTRNVERSRRAGDGRAAGAPVDVLPLEWGRLPLPPALANRADPAHASPAVGVAFAADVLYHWDAHAALLSTLAALADSPRRGGAFQAVVAHKRRGAATSRALDAVLARCGRGEENEAEAAAATEEEEAADAWRGWRVERLARLGRVDLLRLTRRRGEQADASDSRAKAY